MLCCVYGAQRCTRSGYLQNDSVTIQRSLFFYKCNGNKVQSITTRSVVTYKKKTGLTQRCEGETEASSMHRLQALTHPHDHWEEEEKNKRREEKESSRSSTVLNIKNLLCIMSSTLTERSQGHEFPFRHLSPSNS